MKRKERFSRRALSLFFSTPTSSSSYAQRHAPPIAQTNPPPSLQQEKKKKWEPPAPPPRIGRKQRRRDAAAGAAGRLPAVVPTAKCRLRLLKLERLKDWLLMEEEFVASHEALKPKPSAAGGGGDAAADEDDGDRSKVDDLRGSPMSVGTLEEIVDESHAIVSSSVGPEYYVSIMSFVDRSLLEPGCSVLLHNKVRRGGFEERRES
jgi:26S proteasome regulatory subunit T2